MDAANVWAAATGPCWNSLASAVGGWLGDEEQEQVGSDGGKQVGVGATAPCRQSWVTALNPGYGSSLIPPPPPGD